ncbi:MAG: hypothetical protein FJZ96_03870 [Chloroflexi bacterium]|nr:hypothetical protein [Chloroflexota bacterium]
MNKSKGSINKGGSGPVRGSIGGQPARPAGTPRPVPPPRPASTPPTRVPGPAPVPGAGLPSADLAARIDALQSQVNYLQDSARLNPVRDAVEDLQTTVNGMSQRIANLRQAGYVFEKELESQASNLASQWAALYPSIQQQLTAQSNMLLGSLQNINAQMTQLNTLRNNPALAQTTISALESNIGSVKSQVSAAERSVQGTYDQFNSQVGTALQRLGAIEAMLQEFSRATFQLLPTEGAVMAVKAVLALSGKEQKGDPEGALFLTDQRLLFEQREEVVTKKVLFVATEKELVQKLLWESPVALVESIKTSKQGVMKNEDHLDLTFASGAPARTVHFHIWQPSEEWQALINRAKGKEFDLGRAVAIDQSVVDKAMSAPSKCPSCGGLITQVVLRGMDSISCEYCGLVIRLTESAAPAAIAPARELPWGTTTAILVNLGGQASAVMANGKCSVAVIDQAAFDQKLGGDSALQLQVRSILALKLGDVLAQSGSGIANADALGARAVDIAGAIQEAANPALVSMGIKLTRVVVDGFMVNPA